MPMKYIIARLPFAISTVSFATRPSLRTLARRRSSKECHAPPSMMASVAVGVGSGGGDEREAPARREKISGSA
eukprot:3929313-Heterocapsa_arctica.AAC.1